MITISVKYTLICLVLLALLALLVILCIVAVNLITTVKELNKVLDDAGVVSEVAAGTANQVDGIVTNLGTTASHIRSSASDVGVVGAVSNVAKAVSSVAGRGSRRKEGQTPKRKRRE